MFSRMLSFLMLSVLLVGVVGCDDNKTKANGDVPAKADRVSAAPPVAPEPYTPGPVAEPAMTFHDSAPVAAPSSSVAKKSAKAASGVGAGGSYTVQKGDTLTKISQKFYGDATHVKAIVAANGLSDPNKIKAGQVLTLP